MYSSLCADYKVLRNKKLKIKSGKLKIENKSVLFLYLDTNVPEMGKQDRAALPIRQKQLGGAHLPLSNGRGRSCANDSELQMRVRVEQSELSNYLTAVVIHIRSNNSSSPAKLMLQERGMMEGGAHGKH